MYSWLLLLPWLRVSTFIEMAKQPLWLKPPHLFSPLILHTLGIFFVLILTFVFSYPFLQESWFIEFAPTFVTTTALPPPSIPFPNLLCFSYFIIFNADKKKAIRNTNLVSISCMKILSYLNWLLFSSCVTHFSFLFSITNEEDNGRLVHVFH